MGLLLVSLSLSLLPPCLHQSHSKAEREREREMWAYLHNSTPHPEYVCVCVFVLLYSLHVGTLKNAAEVTVVLTLVCAPCVVCNSIALITRRRV